MNADNQTKVNCIVKVISTVDNDYWTEEGGETVVKKLKGLINAI